MDVVLRVTTHVECPSSWDFPGVEKDKNNFHVPLYREFYPYGPDWMNVSPELNLKERVLSDRVMVNPRPVRIVRRRYSERR